MEKTYELLAPTALFEQETVGAAKALVSLVVGTECIPLEGSCADGVGGAQGRVGTVDYYDLEDGLGYRLTYRFEPVADSWQVSMLTGHDVDRNEAWDGRFDVTRERLRSVLLDLDRANAAVPKARGVVRRVAESFAIDLDEK